MWPHFKNLVFQDLCKDLKRDQFEHSLISQTLFQIFNTLQDFNSHTWILECWTHFHTLRWKCAWVPKHFSNVLHFSCLNFVYEPKVKVVTSFMGGSIPCGSIHNFLHFEKELCCCSQVLLHLHNKNCVHFFNIEFLFCFYIWELSVHGMNVPN
jgi:hypothetical protein